jgi:toxin ParE1/3/4
MLRYRLSDAVQADVIDILARTHEPFGEAARLRYESLIVAAWRRSQTDRAASRGPSSARVSGRGTCD